MKAFTPPQVLMLSGEFVVCRLCGAAVFTDPRADFDAVDVHEEWHRSQARPTDREVAHRDEDSEVWPLRNGQTLCRCGWAGMEFFAVPGSPDLAACPSCRLIWNSGGQRVEEPA